MASTRATEAGSTAAAAAALGAFVAASGMLVAEAVDASQVR
jgi:hypothetical protein